MPCRLSPHSHRTFLHYCAPICHFDRRESRPIEVSKASAPKKMREIKPKITSETTTRPRLALRALHTLRGACVVMDGCLSTKTVAGLSVCCAGRCEGCSLSSVLRLLMLRVSMRPSDLWELHTQWGTCVHVMWEDVDCCSMSSMQA